jgi:hypothetical protein
VVEVARRYVGTTIIDENKPRLTRSAASKIDWENGEQVSEVAGRQANRGARTPHMTGCRPTAPRDPGDAADLSIPWGN